ncbi:CPBP family intramembrane glutamic endopeptidase [Thermoleptolyngbya sp. PKUAC-SCTB121]|uniref:CPBP family intramembrane glutamic endopeptidase n=1 Tax=Thermoleptolyngbya sp. PKUAC-SCTB121 TaxID=2811482 RepID=UPI0019645135|nr:CPBP family glutamic-type intramembrane protease [Thermoleptolyngbya sp. PKUAC-SCTB121]
MRRRMRTARRWERWLWVSAISAIAFAFMPLYTPPYTPLYTLLRDTPLQASEPPQHLSLFPSQYASTVIAPFNQPDYYPIAAQPSDAYRPLGDWVGRLILPSAGAYQQTAAATRETDWAWLEVHLAPAEYRDWVGQTVRLAWQPTPLTQAYVAKASRDVRFPPAVQKTLEKGIIHPIRLNGRDRIGPLQSLAGGHPYDDVTVVLRGRVTPEGQPGASPTLRVVREPVQETGRYIGLVKFLEPVPPANPADLPAQCPGELPCESDDFRVRHYNPTSRQFDGAEEIIRVPQQPQDKDGVFNATTRDLVRAPVADAGWYITGSPDRTGKFTVQSMQPRMLVQLQPQQTILDFRKGLDYINFRNWQSVEQRKGTIQSVLIDASANTSENAKAEWKEGDRALLMHLYGGRGGSHKARELLILGTYAGHFSFGLGQVVRDPFTNELIFNLDYLQVYGNGSDGTLSGANTWHNYMGSLIRGKAGTRPVSDVLVKLDTLTEDYDFGGTRLSFFNELLGELSLIGARYRIGDGTGDSTITSAASCVQDSAQGMFLAIQRFRQTVANNPQVMEWLRANPDNPTTQRFRRLARLGRDLEKQLMPMGILRWDWAQNADVLMGVRSPEGALRESPDEDPGKFISIDDFQIRNLLTGLISWRTAMPRQAHDELAMLFLTNGAKLWFLRPNQVGGNDPGIAPLEATLIFGGWKLPFTELPLLTFLVHRTFGGATIPRVVDWLIMLTVLLAFGVVAIALTRFMQRTSPSYAVKQFLTWKPASLSWGQTLLTLVKFLFVPAFLEEYLFRVLLIPYPKPWLAEWRWWGWALLALGLYVLYRWLYLRLTKQQDKTAPLRLVLSMLLGIATILTYRLTESAWTIIALHWIAVSAWWLLLGGWQHTPSVLKWHKADG